MSPRKTRKQGGGRVLDVHSGGAVKQFEKLLKKGPLTLVYVNAKWCGACKSFSDQVWNPLKQLKNKSVNLASLDSEVIGNTSLAKVPRKFYPTLMLVGKDGKPATFEDEQGQPTNAMPRNASLSEDKEALSNLIQKPTVKSEFRRNSPARANFETVHTAKSPFEPNSLDATRSVNVLPAVVNSEVRQMGTTPSKPILTSSPPDVGSDLVSSQGLAPSTESSSSPQMRGGMLDAIRKRTASLKSMLHMRKTRKNRR